MSCWLIQTFVVKGEYFIKPAKKQHYSRLIAQANNKMKKTQNIIKKETGKVHSVEQVPTILVNGEKL